MSKISDAFQYAVEHCSDELGDRSTFVESTLATFTELENLAGGDVR